MALIVGHYARRAGNVTKLREIQAKSPGDIERWLGFRPGRMREGYVVALLAEALSFTDFEFDGTPMRSGGRLGKPAGTKEQDEKRTRVHEAVLAERSSEQYRKMQQIVLRDVSPIGGDRIAKILPNILHDEHAAPDIQYPPGESAGLQWKLLKPGKKFLVAAFVDSSAYAHTPSDSFFIGPGAPYENRAKLAKYLNNVRTDPAGVAE